MSGEPPPPPPAPIEVCITHHNVELQWGDALSRVNDRSGLKGDSRTKVFLQQEDKNGEWYQVYSGYAKRTNVHELAPYTNYRFRVRFETKDGGKSDWSAPCSIRTNKEPPTSEHLHRAVVKQDEIEIVKILDNCDVSIETPNKKGFTCLMVAAMEGHKSVCELLLSKGANVDEPTETRKTALMYAATRGKLAIVVLLREHGASYNARDKGGSTPLHCAVDGGYPEVVSWMIDDGADVNITDMSKNWTPLLRVAAVTGRRDIASLLISKGAVIDQRDKDGKTALMIAIVNGHQQLVQLLLHHNADVNVKNEYGKTAFEMAHSLERLRILKILEDHQARLEDPAYRSSLATPPPQKEEQHQEQIALA